LETNPVTVDEAGKVVRRAKGLKGAIQPPGDLRSALAGFAVATLCEGESTFRNIPTAREVRFFLDALGKIGVPYAFGPGPDMLRIEGRGGPDRSRVEGAELTFGDDLGSLALLAGIVAGCSSSATFIGTGSFPVEDGRLLERAFLRFGMEVASDSEGEYRLSIDAAGTSGITYAADRVDDRLKAAVLLAGLGATGTTSYIEPTRSHDHLERALKRHGAELSTRATGGGRGEYTVELDPIRPLSCRDTELPGDPSLALYLVVAGLLLPRSEILVQGVVMNPSRREALNILTRMGGRIEYKNRRTVDGAAVVDISVRHSKLKGTGITAASIPFLGEDIAALTAAAAFAEGESYIKGAESLRAGSFDLIKALVENMRRLDLEVGEYSDGLVLRGKTSNDSVEFDAFGDPTVAMAMHVVAMACHGETVIHGYDEAVVGRWSDFPVVIEALRID